MTKPLKPPAGSNLVDLGRSAVHAHLGRLRSRSHFAGQEATRKDCGVLVAMLLGHSWTPPPSTGRSVNVGTASGSPYPPASQAGDGQARRQPMGRERGGAPVVVGGRESRPQGEGEQVP